VIGLTGCASCRLYPMAPIDELVRRDLDLGAKLETAQLYVSCRLE
jgi:hypothetical protein